MPSDSLASPELAMSSCMGKLNELSSSLTIYNVPMYCNWGAILSPNSWKRESFATKAKVSIGQIQVGPSPFHSACLRLRNASTQYTGAGAQSVGPLAMF